MGSNSLQGLRVLVVEDEMVITMLIEDMLEAIGCRVAARAASAQDAVAVIRREQFDAAIVDLNLQGEITYNVADVLAAEGVPFLFSTGYPGIVLREDHGHRPKLTKPFTQDDLVRVLTAALEADAAHSGR